MLGLLISVLFNTVSLLTVLVVCTLLAGLAVLLKSDCDLTLKFYERFGKRPDKGALRGKVVWITGASSGIGAHLAYALAACGARLVLSSRKERDLRKVLEKCKELSPREFKERHMVLPLNLLDNDHHQDYAVEVLKEYGQIDILVNNAGRSQRAEAKETTLEVDKAVLELNTIGTLSITKSVLPHMLDQRSGTIVVISSTAGKMGAPGSASYSASKHALQGYFDTLRMELAESGIRVLSICPGPVDTPFIRDIFGTSINNYCYRKSSKVEVEPDWTPDNNRMTVQRCAKLITVAMANQMEEVWLSNHPILLFMYINQYAPTIARWLGKRIGIKRLKAIKMGLKNIDGGFLKRL